GVLTGKLSDFAGLFFAPMVLVAAIQGLWWVATRGAFPWRRALIGASCGLTALCFALVKLSPAVSAWVAEWWGLIRVDPTDLVALPMVLLAARWMHLREAR